MKDKSILGAYIEGNFDVKGLVEVGFFQKKDSSKPHYIKNSKDYERIAARICTFFGLKKITDYSKLEPFGPGLQTEQQKQVTDIVTPKEWLYGDRLISLIETN